MLHAKTKWNIYQSIELQWYHHSNHFKPKFVGIKSCCTCKNKFLNKSIGMQKKVRLSKSIIIQKKVKTETKRVNHESN